MLKLSILDTSKLLIYAKILTFTAHIHDCVQNAK
jgi:hypothetical protein